MTRGLTREDYLEYLDSSIPSIFKVLHLYEEKNPYLIDYVDSLLYLDLYGARKSINEHPKSIWYVKTVHAIEGIYLIVKNEESDEVEIDADTLNANHKRVRRGVLNSTNLIAKQLKELRGE